MTAAALFHSSFESNSSNNCSAVVMTRGGPVAPTLSCNPTTSLKTRFFFLSTGIQHRPEQREEKSGAATRSTSSSCCIFGNAIPQFSRTPINNLVVSVVTNMVVIIASLITIPVLAKLTLF